MNKKVVLGLDTSNYTTSCAICDLDGNVLENYKVLLPVKSGENGLRQSDAVFLHLKNFQIIASQIKEKHAEYEIVALGYSAYPRDAAGSYMPCFIVGTSISQIVSSLYNIPSFSFSHQSGHIRAAVYSSKALIKDDFIAFHVSGGTTEIVLATPDENGYSVKLLGGSVDLHAGQAIDRIGVKMGLQFPCGKAIEALAMENTNKIPSMKVCVKGYECNLSGLENLALKLYNETNDKHLVSAYVLNFVAKTLEKITSNLRNEYPDKKIVYAGGVMSNSIIKSYLTLKFDNIYFSKPEFSTDNAAGIALLALDKYLK